MARTIAQPRASATWKDASYSSLPSPLPRSAGSTPADDQPDGEPPAAAPSYGHRGWAVAVVDLGAAGVGHGGGAVGVEGDRPAPGVDHDQVMEGTQEDQVLEPGPAALALGRGVVYVASCGGGEASRCRAVPVPRDDGAAQ